MEACALKKTGDVKKFVVEIDKSVGHLHDYRESQVWIIRQFLSVKNVSSWKSFNIFMIISLLRTTKMAIVRHAQTVSQNNTQSMYLEKFKHIVSRHRHTMQLITYFSRPTNAMFAFGSSCWFISAKPKAKGRQLFHSMHFTIRCSILFCFPQHKSFLSCYI